MKINKRGEVFPFVTYLMLLIALLVSIVYGIVKYFTKDEEVAKESALIVNQIAQAFIF